MTRFTVQFELPVENPENNVSMKRVRGSIKFFVPVNLHDAHHLGFQELLEKAERCGKLRLVDIP